MSLHSFVTFYLGLQQGAVFSGPPPSTSIKMLIRSESRLHQSDQVVSRLASQSCPSAVAGRHNTIDSFAWLGIMGLQQFARSKFIHLSIRLVIAVGCLAIQRRYKLHQYGITSPVQYIPLHISCHPLLTAPALTALHTRTQQN